LGFRDPLLSFPSLPRSCTSSGSADVTAAGTATADVRSSSCVHRRTTPAMASDACSGALYRKGSAVDVVHSKFTGTDMLAVAASVDAPLFDQSLGPFVLVVARHPTAFQRPILPQGFSFALVDSEGRVQLHSDLTATSKRTWSTRSSNRRR
jgi:hypothetical protein